MPRASKFLLIPISGIFLFFFGLNVDYVSASLSDGLVGHWNLDNGETIDYSGRGNNLINNNAISAKGVFGIDDTAFDFENANSSYLYIADDDYNGLDVVGDMSVSTWVNFKSLPNSRYVIVAKYNENIAERSYFYSLQNDGMEFKLQAILSADGVGNTVHLLSPSHLMATSTWYHFIWVYNSTERTVNFFVDGINIGEASGAPNSLYNSNVTFQIGGYARKWPAFYFDGSIDEVRIYNRVLSEEEIDELYNQFNSPPQPEDFSFVHMTDPHIGSSWIPGHKWYEELSYPRFTDGLYEIGQLEEKPDFILMGGDLVEYAESRWLGDYQSMIDSFTAQTSIPVYAVPGNHDRYMWATGSALCGLSDGFNCDDKLAEYKNQINIPGQGLDENNYLNPDNPLDYRFTHKGIQFIGLDTGADYIPDFEIRDLFVKVSGDKGIEGDGLTDEQMSALENLDLETPKIIFMHHPVLSGGKDYCYDSECPQSVLEDASFVNNYDEFFNWAVSSNLQLALTGHTHRAEVYDEHDRQYDNIAKAKKRPLFIQTQSATHDSSIDHGYRLVDVESGAVNPQNASSTKNYIKLISQLETESNHEFRLYDSEDDLKYVKVGDIDGLSAPFFIASSSKRILLYGLDENRIKLQVWQKDVNDKNFGLNTKIEGVVLDDVDYENDFGYRIGNIFKRDFVNFHLENKLAMLNVKNISFEDSNKYQFAINWDDLIETEDINNLEVMNDFDQNSGEILQLKKLKYSIIAKLFSPAELVIIDNDTGSSTGIVNHGSIEEIDYSLSDEARERVLIYDGEDLAGKNFIYRVRGLEDIYGSGDNDFSLKIVYRIDDENEEEIKEVNIIGMPINASTTYQFYVDWENLSDTGGVIMEIDEDGDGIFEIRVELGQEINSDNPYCLRIKMIFDLEEELGTQADEKINFIIGLIKKSINPEWWDGEHKLNQENGDNVFKTDLITVQKLRLFLRLDSVFSDKKYIPEFIEDKFELPEDVRAVFEDVLNGLLNSDITLVQSAVNSFTEEVDSKKDEKILKNAEKKLEKADQLLHDEKIQVVQFCQQAWRAVNF